MDDYVPKPTTRAKLQEVLRRTGYPLLGHPHPTG